MNISVPPTLKPLAVAVAACILEGCAAWPGSSLPTVPELSKEAEEKTPAGDGCAKSTDDALRCARYLSSVLSEVESDTGTWDTWYSIGSIAAGTLAAIYMKSDTDRTQALEDLAVTVAALAGIRGVLKPDDRRRIAREGRAAVDCMIAAADGITLYAGQAEEKEKAAQDKQGAEAAVAHARANLAGAKRDLEAKTSRKESVGEKTKENEAAFTTAESDLVGAQDAVSAAETAVTMAQHALATAEVRATNTPFRRFDRAVDKEFGITTTLRDSNAPRNLQPNNRSALAPATDQHRFAVGLLLQRQGRDLEAATEKANTSAKVAEALLPKTLAYGVYEVLNHVRSSIADLASAPEKIAKTQRDTVNGLIAELKAKADTETEAATKLEGASAVTPATEPERVAEAQDLVDSKKTPAKKQIAMVFQQCVAPGG